MSGVRHDEHSRARVLENFRKLGRIDLATEAAGVARGCHYAWLKEHPDYAAEFQQIRTEAIDSLEEVAFARAKDSSDRLLEFLLKGLKPEVYGDRMKSEISGPGGGSLVVEFVRPGEKT
jgi:hypothetical protein